MAAVSPAEVRLGEVIQPRLPPLVEREEEARSEGGGDGGGEGTEGGGEGTEGGGEGTEGGGGAFSGPCRLTAIANTARLRATHAPYPARVPPVRGSDSHSGGQAGQSRANPSSNPDLALTRTLVMTRTLVLPLS